MSTKALDLTGQRFGTLMVLNLHANKSPHGQRQWDCLCDCGNRVVILGGSLRSGNTTRCNDHPKNEYCIDGDVVTMDVSTKTFPNMATQFDLSDLDRVINFRNQTGRMRWIYTDSSERDDVAWGKYVMGTDRKTRLHRFVLSLDDPQLVVDHINGDTFDNRKSNLRVITRSENNKNMRKRSTNTSGHTGVYVDSKSGLFVASIQLHHKKLYLGKFDLLSEANIAYRAAAKALSFSERHGL